MPDWAEFVHFERIPERSALHDFHIEPHVHPALIQLLFTLTWTVYVAFLPQLAAAAGIAGHFVDVRRLG